MRYSSTTRSASRNRPPPPNVEVTLDITPGVPHVFQAYFPILDEAARHWTERTVPVQRASALRKRVTG